jgi:hypothetical protein
VQVHSRFLPVVDAAVSWIHLYSTVPVQRRKFLPYLGRLIGLCEVTIHLSERPRNHLAALAELGLREHMPPSVRRLSLNLALPMVRRRPPQLILGCRLARSAGTAKQSPAT